VSVFRHGIWLVALWSGTAHALSGPTSDDQSLPCRPTIACTADIVPPGFVELEVGALFRRLGDRTLQLTTPFLLKLSVARSVQLQVSSNGYTLQSAPDRAHFFDNVSVGAKIRLHEQDALLPSVSISAAIGLPSSAAGVQSGYTPTYDLFTTIYVSKDFDRLHADLNMGVNLWQLGTVLFQPWTSLALSTDLGHHLTAMAESYVFGSAAPVSPPDAGILMAVAFGARSWLVLDGGIDVGLWPSTRTISAFVGFTILPVNFYPRRARSVNTQ
jgi:hypothetical protein